MSIDRAKVLAAIAEIVPDFKVEEVLSVLITPTHITADIAGGGDTKWCWKPGCRTATIHSHPKRWDVK